VRLLSLVFVAALVLALPATADTIHGYSHDDADDSGSVITSVELHPSHDVRIHDRLSRHDKDKDEDAKWDKDSDAGDGPSAPTPHNDPVVNDPVAAPEPNTLLLLGIALAVVFLGKRSPLPTRAA
jgi:hypothetical protein